MAKRPLCVICSCFILLILLTGAVRTADPPDGLLSPQMVSDVQTAGAGRIYGQIYRLQAQENGCVIYLKNTILLVRSNRYILNNSKITYEKLPAAVIGDSVMVTGKLSFAEPASNPGQFDAQAYDMARHISIRMRAKTLAVTKHGFSPVPEMARRLRQCIGSEIDHVLEKKEAGVLKTMLLGDKQELDAQIRQLYQKNGISHILAISGLHISVLGAGLYRLLRKKLTIKPAAGLSGGFLFFYLILTDFPVSAQRAVCMFWLRLGADVTGRTYDEPTAIAVAAMLILCQNPRYITDSSFLLSFGAACAVCILKKAKVSNRWFGVWLWLYMLPLTMLFYYEVSFNSLVLNLLVLPPLSLLLFLGLSGGVLGCMIPFLGKILLWPAGLLLKCYELLCALCASVPFSSVILGAPQVWQIIVYLAGLTGVLIYRKRQKEKTVKEKNKEKEKRNPGRWKENVTTGMVCVLLAGMLVYRFPSPVSVTMLDVGQGDGLVIHQGYRAMLVDGGSTTVSEVGRYRIAPYLKYKGIRKIERIFLTHADADHMNGLEELLEMIQSRELGMSVGGIVVPAWMQKKTDSVRLLVLAAEMHIPVTYAKAGQGYQSGKIGFTILHPSVAVDMEGNAGSLTFRMETDGFSMLFTGDLEGEGEKEVCGKNITCDILKVAHHGSKNSTSEEFLQRAKAKTALISVGKKNTYGHPAEETLKRLKKAGSICFTTEDCGALNVTAKQGKIAVRGYQRTKQRTVAY